MQIDEKQDNISSENVIIHCLGDSHVNLFSGNDFIQPIWPENNFDKVSFFKTYRLGSHLAYSLSNKQSEANKKLNKAIKQIPNGSYLLISYGEIDCRVHLLKQALLQKKELIKVVHECVNGYFSILKSLKKRGFNVLISEVIPSTRYNIAYHEFITFGSTEERNLVSAIFNNRLRELAMKNQMPIVSVSKYLINKKLETGTEYYLDPIHLSTKALPFVISELNKNVKYLNLKLIGNSNYLLYLYYCVFRKHIYICFISLKQLVRIIMSKNINIHKIDKKREKLLLEKYKNEFDKYYLAINN